MENIEWIGYAASAFIILSFLISGNLKLTRTINLAGCILFVIYGYVIDSFPVVIPNAFLIFVQLYFLFIKKERA